MKKILVFTLFLMATTGATFAQSHSFEVFHDAVGDERDVACVSVGNFVLRAALLLADEDDLRDQLRDIHSIHVVHAPGKVLREQNLRLSGFRKILKKDNFEPVVEAHEGDDHIEIYMREGNHGQVYFVLIENDDKVTAVELYGRLDPQKLVSPQSRKRITHL